ncbi:MAG: polyprenyl synthetase family protein [Oligoflexia bacterium]|nr:polyprenyl synthetase family protein [Oligoflexia bacterium]
MLELMPQDLANSLETLDLRLEIPQEIPELQTLLYETVLAGGKRFRPGLCLMMGSVLGVEPAKAAPYARVAELMHAATLAHDDVIDEATKRRNKPTLNQIASNQKAVLTGDLLLARVVYEIADLGDLDILREGSQVLEDLVRGEWLQIERRGKSRVQRANLELAAQKKTASLIAWCCTTPARLSGAPSGPTAKTELIERCRRLGNLIGISFQMADDILDFEVDGEKPYANDLREGLVNFVVLEMQERDPSMVAKAQEILDFFERNGAHAAGSPWPWSPAQLEEAREGVRRRVREMLDEARRELRMIAELSPAPEARRAPATEALDQILFLMAERVR